MNKRMQQM